MIGVIQVFSWVQRKLFGKGVVEGLYLPLGWLAWWLWKTEIFSGLFSSSVKWTKSFQAVKCKKYQNTTTYQANLICKRHTRICEESWLQRLQSKGLSNRAQAVTLLKFKQLNFSMTQKNQNYMPIQKCQHFCYFAHNSFQMHACVWIYSYVPRFEWTAIILIPSCALSIPPMLKQDHQESYYHQAAK